MGNCRRAAGSPAARVCFLAMGDRYATRISVSEMKRYYMFSEWCSWLLSVAEGESVGPATHRPFGVARPGVLGMARAFWLRGHGFRAVVTCAVHCEDGSCGFLVLVRDGAVCPE